ncbi:MAG: hypothetical protein H0V51_15140 [Chloroflexi bacterium]|nr:hypothetical protein [Chloroflexota bacterium]
MDDFPAVRRRVAHQLYHKLAFLSAAIWAVGTLLLFITFAAGNPRPIPMAALSMTLPLLPAALPWLLYRPLTDRLASRRMRVAAQGAEQKLLDG